MTQLLLANGPIDSVLEVGTGCGYQTAILAQLVKRVCTIERVLSLQESAERRLRDLEFRNIEYAHGDGYQGWRARAPFDAIMITAAPRAIPEILIEQLSLGGKMVLPVGDEKNQHLQVLTRTEEGHEVEPLMPIRFVPLQPGVLA